MLPISRSSNESSLLNKLFEEDMKKQGCYFERASFGTRYDPLEDKDIDDNIWHIQGSQLVKKKKVNGERK